MDSSPSPARPVVERGGGIRLVLVEWHAMLRDALACMLASAEFVTVTDPGTSAHLDLTLREHRPDVVVVGIDPGVSASFALIRQIPAITRQWRTVVLTTPHHPTMHARAIELGAMGIVTIDESGDVLVKAIRKVVAGELWLDRTRAAGVVTSLRGCTLDVDPERKKVDALTRREREIVDLVTEGLTNKLIAERLRISEATVRNHLTSVLDKLDLADRFQLAVFAFRRGLVPCPHSAKVLLEGSGSDVPWKRVEPSSKSRQKAVTAG